MPSKPGKPLPREEWQTVVDRSPRPCCEALGIVSYLVAAFLTFGLVFNQGCGWRKVETFTESSISTSTSYKVCAEPVLAGAFWPVYWAGVGAIKVTK